MLVWSRSGRWLAWGFAALLIGSVYVAPLAIILAASFAGQWNDVLPSLPTVEHYLDAVSGQSGEALWTSVVTGMVASAIALLLGGGCVSISMRPRHSAPEREARRLPNCGRATDCLFAKDAADVGPG